MIRERLKFRELGDRRAKKTQHEEEKGNEGGEKHMAFKNIGETESNEVKYDPFPSKFFSIIVLQL